MKKYEKEILQAQLNNEKAVLKQLEQTYKDALSEINGKIAMLLGRDDTTAQHVVYQLEYQRALKTQVEAIIETLHAKEFETVSEYLTHSYEEGYIGALYSLQQQGVPFLFPLDQEQIITAIQHETMLSENLYAALGKETKAPSKHIASEISRGIATGAMYSEISRNVAAYAGITKNNAMRIVRTESHRIQCKASMDACYKAKNKGAEVAKQWNAALDARTRDSHARVDGEIRELGGKFSNGLKYPGESGAKAAEVINCRCVLNQRAKWRLGAEETKALGDVSKMSDKQKEVIAKKLNVPTDELGMYSNQVVPIKAKDYDDFKKQYYKLMDNESRVRSNLQKIKNRAKASDVFLYGEDVPINATITPDAVLKNLSTSPIGRETIDYLEKTGIKPKLIYDKQYHTDRGDQRGKVINIYISNVANDLVAAQTVIHEITHYKYDIGGCQWAEAVCMAKEKMHKEGRDYLTPDEKRYIVELAKKAYPEFKWKKGGYKNGKKF